MTHLPNPSLSHSLSSPGATFPADFSSDYISLYLTSLLRARSLAEPHATHEILGSCIIVFTRKHAALEARLARNFRPPMALLFHSGFDTNAGFFASRDARCHGQGFPAGNTNMFVDKAHVTWRPQDCCAARAGRPCACTRLSRRLQRQWWVLLFANMMYVILYHCFVST